MKTVGIIGFGSFGKFLAEKLDPYVDVQGFSSSGKAGKWSKTFEEVVASDYLILSIPLDAYETTLLKVEPLIAPHTIIVDVCSVKLNPVKKIRDILPNQPIVSTHPLFGPESASDSLEGHVVVLCPEQSTGHQYQSIKDFCIQTGLTVIEMTAEEHDREMATVHGLTFFVAHSLKDMGLHSQKLATPSFRKLLSLAELEKQHSLDLFKTIQEGNPFAEKIRHQFTDEVNTLSVLVAAGSDSDDVLSQPRKKIDEIDRRLVSLLSLRSKVVTEVAEIKRRNNLLTHQEDRYTNMVKRLEAMAAEQGLDERMISEIWELIHAYSKRQQANDGVSSQ
jgi:prephenate dehydrogenase